MALVANKLPNSRIHRYDIMGTRCSGCEWSGDQSPFSRPSNGTINRPRGLRWVWRACVPVRSCASDQICCVSKVMLNSVRATGNLSSSPFVWIGREKVQSLLRWAGPFSQIQAGYGRQASRQQGWVWCCEGIQFASTLPTLRLLPVNWIGSHFNQACLVHNKKQNSTIQNPPVEHVLSFK